jgi:hypothetical protein
MASDPKTFTFTIDEMIEYILFIQADHHFWQMIQTEIIDLTDEQMMNHVSSRIRVWILNRKFDWEVVK